MGHDSESVRRQYLGSQYQGPEVEETFPHRPSRSKVILALDSEGNGISHTKVTRSQENWEPQLSLQPWLQGVSTS